MDTSNNFEEKSTSKENEIVEKILEENNTYENESNNISSRDHEIVNFNTKEIDYQDKNEQGKYQESKSPSECNNNQESIKNLRNVEEHELADKLNNNIKLLL
jgi:hypothetical protein